MIPVMHAYHPPLEPLQETPKSMVFTAPMPTRGRTQEIKVRPEEARCDTASRRILFKAAPALSQR